MIDPLELSIVDRSGYDISLILSHNIQHACTVDASRTELIVTIGGMDNHIETAQQVTLAVNNIIGDYQTQLDELGIAKSKPRQRRPTPSLDLTGLSPNRVARIITITEE